VSSIPYIIIYYLLLTTNYTYIYKIFLFNVHMLYNSESPFRNSWTYLNNKLHRKSLTF